MAPTLELAEVLAEKFGMQPGDSNIFLIQMPKHMEGPGSGVDKEASWLVYVYHGDNRTFRLASKPSWLTPMKTG